MPLVFAAATNHGPGITARRDTAPPEEVTPFFEGWERLHQRMEAANLDALVMISSDHIQNLYMDNMPAFIIGLETPFRGRRKTSIFSRFRKRSYLVYQTLPHRLPMR